MMKIVIFVMEEELTGVKYIPPYMIIQGKSYFWLAPQQYFRKDA